MQEESQCSEGKSLSLTLQLALINQSNGKMKTRVDLAPWPTIYLSDSCFREVPTKPGTPMPSSIPFVLLGSDSQCTSTPLELSCLTRHYRRKINSSFAVVALGILWHLCNCNCFGINVQLSCCISERNSFSFQCVVIFSCWSDSSNSEK